MAEKKDQSPAEQVDEALKKSAADITGHKASDLKAYDAVDVDYMNFSSVARKPFEAQGEESKSDEGKADETPPRAPTTPRK